MLFKWPEKFDGFQILVAAIAVRYPLTVLASIVQIKHGSYGIHAQTVYVELLDPVEGVGNQKIGNLMLFIVKDLGIPSLDARLYADLRTRRAAVRQNLPDRGHLAGNGPEPSPE